MNDEINVVMILLEKAEQILSYVNLPLSTLKKYNELKEITFKKLNYQFTPLIKAEIPDNMQFKMENEIQSKYINLLRDSVRKKNNLVDYFTSMIENYLICPSTCKSSNDYNLSLLIQNLNCEYMYMSKEFNNEEVEFELRMEDIKLKEQLGKAESLSKRISLLQKEDSINSGMINKKHSVSIILNLLARIR